MLAAMVRVLSILVLSLVISSAVNLRPVTGWVGDGYNLISVSNLSDGSGIKAILTPVTSGNVLYGSDIPVLEVIARYESSDMVHVHITDANNTRWEIPQSVIPRLNASDPPNRGPHSGVTNNLAFSYTSSPFGFAITRVSTGDVLFNCTPGPENLFGPLVFKDQYLELSTVLPSNSALYGLGESTRPDGLRLTPGRLYTLWNMDIAAATPNIDLYGSYPYYVDVRDGGNTHSVLLLNSNGMDVYYNGSSITFKPIGGILDVYIFGGPTPAEVLDQYTSVIGRPAPMPLWTLGYHQCKYGYKSVEELQYVVGNYSEANIPLDTMWSDIDHMDVFKDFTLDPVNYPEEKVQQFVEQLHADGQHYVLIVDPGIHVNDSYETYARGMAADIFIKNPDGTPFLGQVWPGAVFFPDFLHPQIQPYWTNEIQQFQSVVAFDGLWIDMNEISNFCDGTQCTLAQPTNPNDFTTCFLICSPTMDSKYENPPYWINDGNGPKPLDTKTIGVNAVHASGEIEYNAHNLFGFTESIATNKALVSVRNKRPFVLSRSTFVGSGAYTAHWTGDNAATWNDIGWSVVSILNSGLFGVPMVGADICGFNGDTTEELCGRWIQLGAFYPFARNHAGFSSIPHELYRWDSVANISRTVLAMRYRLLPFLYTLVYETHTTGSPIARPLFFHYSSDPNTLNINSQYLLGSSILVSPVLTEGATQLEAYFPQGTWYNLFDYTQVVNATQGSNVTLDAPFETINVHVGAGAIIPMQDAGLTTGQVRASNFTLLVALANASDDQAAGELFLDDGEQVEMSLTAENATFVSFQAEIYEGRGSLFSNVAYGQYATHQGWSLKTVILLGASAVPSANNLVVNGSPAPSSVIVSQIPGAVRISGLTLPIGHKFTLTWG